MLSRIFCSFFILFSIPNILITPAFAQAYFPKISQGTIYLDCSSENLKNSGDEKVAPIPFEHVCFSKKIIPSLGVTYYQALRKIFPDLQTTGRATILKARRADWKDISSKETGEKKGAEFNLSNNVSYLLVQEKTQSQLVLLAEERGLFGVLALFEISPDFKLTDLIEAGAGPEHISLLITPPQSAFLVKKSITFFPITYWHDNSDESYDTYAFFLTLAGKLHRVYDGPSFYGFRDPKKHSCRNMEGLEELKPLKTAHEDFLDISLKVNQMKSCEVKQSKGLPQEKTIYKKIYSSTLHWDSKRQQYMGGSKDFVKHGFQP